MKLYATTTTERASKGQGGNDFLNIEIIAEGFEGIPTRANLYRISISKMEDNGLYCELLKYSNHEVIVLDNLKGNKKTSEQCTCGGSELPRKHSKGDCKNPY
jgi:hypothetical protein